MGVLVAFAMRRPKGMLLLAGFALGGAVVATALAFMVPDTYTSTAVVRLRPPLFPERPSGAALAASMAERLRHLQQEVFSRASLAEIVQHPSLDLYRSERSRKPLEEIVETMRTQDLAIRTLSSPATEPGSGFEFSISFSYPDKRKAKRVVEEIASRLVNQWILARRAMQKDMRPGDETVVVMERRFGDELEILDPPSLPQSPVAPNRMIFVEGGMGSGLLIGALALRMRQRGKQKLRTA